MANETKPADKAPEPQKPEDNPKIVAPKGTVPTAAQAPGPSLPHPSVEDGVDRTPTKEVAEAQARAAAEVEDADDEAPTTRGVAPPAGDPIQCIAKKKFFDERGATIKAGATYYYQPREGVAFPAEVLEPVNRTLAKKFAEEDRKRRRERADRLERKQASREALRRLAAETE